MGMEEVFFILTGLTFFEVLTHFHGRWENIDMTERKEAALACIALRKQQDVSFSDMLQTVQGHLVWVESVNFWGCVLSKRLMSVTESEHYVGSNMWGELLKC